MSRETDFRAWDIKKKKMFESHIPHDSEYWDGVDTCNLGMINSCLKNDSFIFLQYTGLKTEYGTKIYEGDIIGFESLKYEIVFKDGRFCVKGDFSGALDKTHTEAYLFTIRCFKVIGNIYENPELLK